MLAARVALRRSPFVAPLAAHGLMTVRRLCSSTLRPSADELIKLVMSEEMNSAQKIVPWFLNQMPDGYFEKVSESTRLEHLKAISALFRSTSSNMDFTITSETADGDRDVTCVRHTNYIGLLFDVVSELPVDPERGLSRALAFTSKDSNLLLNVFTHSASHSRVAPDAAMVQRLTEYAKRIQNGEFASDAGHPAPCPALEPAAINKSLARIDARQMSGTPERHALKQLVMFDRIVNTDDVVVDIDMLNAQDPEYIPNQNRFWITVALSNALPRLAFRDALHVLKVKDLDVVTAHLNTVWSESKHRPDVVFVRVLVNPPKGNQAPSKVFWNDLTRDLRRIKWLDDETPYLLMAHPSLGFQRAEIIVGLATLSQRILSKANTWSFSFPNVMQMLRHERFVKNATAIADLFMERFDPVKPLADVEFQRTYLDLKKQIDTQVESIHAAALLTKMLDAVFHTYRTNFYMPSRYAFSVRINPAIMDDIPEALQSGTDAETPTQREVPLGVFFVHGDRFNAFHVRFRDIARGGVRLVTPPSREQFGLECAHQYDETYNLAYTQQKKNKDIPEGGSKAVILVDTIGMDSVTKNYTMRKSIRAFADSLLDLIVKTDETDALVKDYWGKPELLYLGPDEQVIPSDISWVVTRAGTRGHPVPSTFMSSRANEGINHKEFGVTSEGAAVFLASALKYKGINPKKVPFTVKITGGPSGDVAGNMIRILFRDYGENARIVAVADHSGSVEDPNGLNSEELLRLVQEELAVSDFSKDKLGPRGAHYTIDTEHGTRMRNSMHLRVVADAFIPAGGRPRSISLANWKQFLREDGTPSSSIIVEGANLFITEEAREKLFREAKVLIVKDSSANKCGVITSSYEIISAMLLDREEFMTHKKEIVADVLVKLREFASMEADLLFREFHNYPGALPYFSNMISEQINVVKDSIMASLKDLSPEKLEALVPAFEEHLPATVLRIARHRILQRVPRPYLVNAIATRMATQMVYNEGSVFVNTLPHERLGELAVRYRAAQSEIKQLTTRFETDSLTPAEKTLATEMLRMGGARVLMNADLSRD